MRKLSFLLISVILFFCDSEESICRLSRYGVHGIFYDDQGRVYSVKFMNGDEVVNDGYHKEFEYDDDDRVIKVREYSGNQLFQYFEVEYAEDQIIERKFTYSESEGGTINSNTFTFNLDKNGKILSIDRIDYSRNPDVTSHEMYEYNDQGNVKKITLIEDTDPVWSLVSEFEFDKKLNPFRLVKFDFRLGSDDLISDKIQNKNNITRVSLLYAGDDQPHFVDIKYVYNDRGYPADFVNNTTDTKTYAYECN